MRSELSQTQEISWFFIQPFDKVLFRDGRPFNAGESTHASSLSFLPTPQTVAGLFRSLIGKNVFKGVFNNLGNSSTSPIQFYGPIFAINKNNKVYPYFYAPTDLLIFKTSKKNHKNNQQQYKDIAINYWIKNNNLTSLKNSNVNKNLYLFPWNKTNVKVSPTSEFFLSDDGLIKWLKNDYSEPLAVINIQSDDFPRSETIVQNRIDPESKTSWEEEGGLFSIQYYRYPFDDGFLVGMSFPKNAKNKNALNEDDVSKIISFFSDNPTGTIFLGGERRIAEYQLLKNNPLDNLIKESNKITDSDNKVNYKKLYFITPALFENGFMPNNENEIVGISINSTFPIGGWDYKKRRSKPLKLAISPGSVYIIKNEKESSFYNFNFNINSELSTLGFGLTLCSPKIDFKEI